MGDENAISMTSGGGPFCHIVNAKVYTYVNFFNFQRGGRRREESREESPKWWGGDAPINCNVGVLESKDDC